MKNYYEVLGLSETATDQEIKYVFRRLAVTYHPDKNPAPEAEAIFKEVSEAYEVLSDPHKRQYYDQLLLNSGSLIVLEDKPGWYRDPAYRKRRQAGYKPPPPGPSPRTILMRSFLKYVDFLTVIGCLWCGMLILDYALPLKISTETVVSEPHALHKAMLKGKGDLLLTDKGHHFPIHMSELKYFPFHSSLKIFHSSIFSLLVKVENEESSYQLNNLATIYRNFIFVPLLLFILTVTGVVWRKGTDFRFSLGIVMFMIFLLNIGFFFMSKV